MRQEEVPTPIQSGWTNYKFLKESVKYENRNQFENIFFDFGDILFTPKI